MNKQEYLKRAGFIEFNKGKMLTELMCAEGRSYNNALKTMNKYRYVRYFRKVRMFFTEEYINNKTVEELQKMVGKNIRYFSGVDEKKAAEREKQPRIENIVKKLDFYLKKIKKEITQVDTSKNLTIFVKEIGSNCYEVEVADSKNRKKIAILNLEKLTKIRYRLVSYRLF